MTTVKLTIAIIAFAALAGPAAAQYGSNSNDHSVTGHYRSDGSYVQPHHRTNPNNSTYDNYGSSGNYNPYTGQTGSRYPR